MRDRIRRLRRSIRSPVRSRIVVTRVYSKVSRYSKIAADVGRERPILIDENLSGIEVSVVNWVELPDLAAVTLLAAAFASVAHRSQTHISKVWLVGWLMIVLHFTGFLFLNLPGNWGTLAESIGLDALTWAGLLFMWASVPYWRETSSQWMLAALIVANTLYISVLVAGPAPAWSLNLAAALFGLLPVAVAVSVSRKFSHPLRWAILILYCALSIFLLIFQHRPGIGVMLALNAVMFTVYFGCSTHFWYTYRRATTGALITIAGFFAWAGVFVAGPAILVFLPQIHVENGAWNLPKYLVALGMILLLLEDQIEHNRHLALHDHLTGLPNRRLFQDRLASALDRARRSESNAALLLIDLNQFKHVNDTLGHHTGDLLLQRVASILSGRVRRSDTVARTGGDEFSIILEEPTCRADAAQVAQFLVQLLSEPMQLGEHTVQIGASVGIAVFPEDSSDSESLCIAADLRMYNDKRNSVDEGADAPSAVAAPYSEPAPQAKAALQMGR
jgi:diguanylate cyclase (GGDEF)-like protein